MNTPSLNPALATMPMNLPVPAPAASPGGAGAGFGEELQRATRGEPDPGTPAPAGREPAPAAGRGERGARAADRAADRAAGKAADKAAETAPGKAGKAVNAEAAAREPADADRPDEAADDDSAAASTLADLGALLPGMADRLATPATPRVAGVARGAGAAAGLPGAHGAADVAAVAAHGGGEGRALGRLPSLGDLAAAGGPAEATVTVATAAMAAVATATDTLPASMAEAVQTLAPAGAAGLADAGLVAGAALPGSEAARGAETGGPLGATAGGRDVAEDRLHTPLGSRDFAQALGARVAVFARDGVEHARLNIHPAELGPIALQLALDGTQLRVDMSAAMAATRQALEQALPGLASALAEAGLTLSGGGVFDQRRDERGAATAGRAAAAGPDGRASDDLADTTAPGLVARRSRIDGLVDLYA